MPSSFASSDIVRVHRALEAVSQELDKLDEGTEEHKRKIKDLMKDVEDIRSRFDNLMTLLGFDEE